MLKERVERTELFSKVAGAGVFRTRYGLIAFIVVNLEKL